MITTTDLDNLQFHWAVAAIPADRRFEAENTAKRLLTKTSFEFLESANWNYDFDSVYQLALAYQIAAIEALDELVKPLSANPLPAVTAGQAAAFKAFGLLRVLPLPSDWYGKATQILTLCALGYSSERGSDVKRWLSESAAEKNFFAVPEDKSQWNVTVFQTLYRCWIALFTKSSWSDVHQISEQIVKLRELQKEYETDYLEKEGGNSTVKACGLIALYHLARATEVLAEFILQGQPRNIRIILNQQFDFAQKAAEAISDAQLELILKWLHIAAIRMTANSVWSVSHQPHTTVGQFLESVTKTRNLFEFLPPQQAAIQRHGLLDPATKAIVVDLPTSAGKTMLAQFRILQALNLFDNGWVAYVAPTRALVGQITRQLRRDFEPLGIHVEQLTAAVTLDQFEEELLLTSNSSNSFQVLVSTPEKLEMVIRNNQQTRPLVLLVMDEAHNIEDAERGLRIELLLATVKRECVDANFLLLTPFVPNSQQLAEWLEPESGKSISLAASAWQPNERIIGLYSKQKEAGPGNWSLNFEVLDTGYKSLSMKEHFHIPGPRPIDVAMSKATRTTMTGAMAKFFSQRGTSIAVTRTIPDCWSIARKLQEEMPENNVGSEEIDLVQRFLAAEVSDSFELIQMLKHGIGVHHAGLSDEARSLIEWLAESNKLKVLCATTTIAQGINFPVSSVFLASKHTASYSSDEMSGRTFWNLAGRAGRIGQGSLGMIGLAAQDDEEQIREYVKARAGELHSRFVAMLRSLSEYQLENDLDLIIQDESWIDFRKFVSHLVNHSKDKSQVVQEADLLLRNTLGYTELANSNDAADKTRANALLKVTRRYAGSMRMNEASLVDSTGFAPEAIRSAMAQMSNLDKTLTFDDWRSESLFGPTEKSILKDLVGIMLSIPQLRGDGKINLKSKTMITSVAGDWVNGQSLEAIAKTHFSATNTADTESLTAACQGIYRTIGNFGTWGISALSKIPNSGIDFETLTKDQISEINRLPAMLYHGVKSPEAVLMRMNNVPRSIAEPLGKAFSINSNEKELGVRTARNFISSLTTRDWDVIRPSTSAMSGADYQTVWKRLSGS